MTSQALRQLRTMDGTTVVGLSSRVPGATSQRIRQPRQEPHLNRSQMMANIRSRDTSPELVVRRYLHRAGLRFRLHAKQLPGTPDIFLPASRAAVLVHGCFWHRHAGCRFTTNPSTRVEFWAAKFRANQARDEDVIRRLRKLGIRVFVVWECECMSAEKLDELYWALRATE
jgi:DNA mismatch endonuclease, patch repair protein